MVFIRNAYENVLLKFKTCNTCFENTYLCSKHCINLHFNF